MAGEDAAVVPGEALGIAGLRPRRGGLILAAHSEAQAARLAAMAEALAAPLRPCALPSWDCLPFDRSGPSRAVMGRRMRALAAMAQGEVGLLVASVEALAQCLPDPASLARLDLRVGQTIARDEIEAALSRLGYAIDEEADMPGEAAIRGAVIDLVPADGASPVRIRTEGEDAALRVAGLDRYDARTQRSRGAVDSLSIGPASEIVFGAPQKRPPGLEHRLPELGRMFSVFALMPDARLLLDAEAPTRMEEHLRQVAEARETRIALCRATGGALPAEGLYLDAGAWQAALASHGAETVHWPVAEALPDFRAGDAVARAASFVARQLRAGRRVGLSGRRLARALDADTVPADGWAALLALPPGTAAELPAGLPQGFASAEAVVLAAADVLPPLRRAGPQAMFDVALHPGDAVIHLEYGMARLAGIETVATDREADFLQLDFAGDTRKLVACGEMDKVWRYAAGAAGLRLDSGDGVSWARRRDKVLKGIAATAAGLVRAAAARAQVAAPAIRPPRRAVERFAAGFPYAPTPDQHAAFADIAADLDRPHPMHRLLCGDVGFGKTEAALRAAAAAALCGHQVAVLAPTTVLVRQHLATFRKRFAAIGIEVAGLSRLTPAAEAREIRARLADGSLLVVVGTQALAGQDVRFAGLALVIIDEEQRFGTSDKAALAALRDGVHALTLTATPIPRTLQGALAGVQALSVLATPPARRRPVRTTVLPYDPALVRAALAREHARGGQSFCVCPRISDIAGIARELAALVPELSVVALHGRMKPDALDAAIAGFADGHGDVLLATDIIESGLDIPRANSILVWHADRFGLAQLHQLRGRVGRSATRGMAWLFTDPDAPPGPVAAERLAGLAAHDGLGAGFAISARDLDLRGAGDLLGKEQAGHVRLLGVELARHLLGIAMARARGEPGPAPPAEVSLGLSGFIPADYMPDPATRIALHARLARPRDAPGLDDELEDRFGPLPDPVRILLAEAALRRACARLGIARLDAGPAAVAVEMADLPANLAGVEYKDARLLLRRESDGAAGRIAAARALLRLIRDAAD